MLQQLSMARQEHIATAAKANPRSRSNHRPTGPEIRPSPNLHHLQRISWAWANIIEHDRNLFFGEKKLPDWLRFIMIRNTRTARPCLQGTISHHKFNFLGAKMAQSFALCKKVSNLQLPCAHPESRKHRSQNHSQDHSQDRS